MAGSAGLVALLGLLWGLNWPAARLALDGFPPFTFRAIGFTGATVLLFLAIRVRGLSPVVPRAHWGRLILVGTLSVVSYNLLSAFAQITASTARAAVLSYTMPIWAVLIARPVLGERFDARRVFGLLFGAAGLLALGLPIVAAGAVTPGLLFALLSGIAWAFGSVLLKRFPIAAPPLVFTAWQIALGALVTVLAALAVDGVPTHVPRATGVWIGLAYNVVIGQAVATTLWFTILARLPAGVAAIGSLLVPGIGVVGATVILGEHPLPSDWLGLVLIVGAAAIVLLRRTPPTTLSTPAHAIVETPVSPTTSG